MDALSSFSYVCFYSKFKQGKEVISYQKQLHTTLLNKRSLKKKRHPNRCLFIVISILRLAFRNTKQTIFKFPNPDSRLPPIDGHQGLGNIQNSRPRKYRVAELL